MAPHPLDPLSVAELQAAAGACRARNDPDAAPLRFNVITLQEPPKADLIAFAKDGTVPVRQAFCILQSPPSTLAVEAVVDLSSGPKAAVTSWKTVDGVKPLATPDDCFEAEDICKADAEVVDMLRERGLTDLSLVVCDPWSVHMAPTDLAAGKLIQLFMYFRTEPNDNHYAHPLDFTPIVDLYQKKVVRIDRPHGKERPELPKKSVNYHRELAEKGWRKGLKPLTVQQPDGPSFTVDGNLIKWQKWHIRHSFNYREGLVLHDVGYEDGGRVRPVLHRMSLVEMCVPYGDPNPPYQRKCAFDVGDYGLGYCSNSLELGCDCLGTIKYFDADMIDSKGEPWTVKKAVCVHEEDAGICWKHTEYRDGHAEVRRNRRLVLSFIATVVNYEYAFYVSFYLDGSIGYEIKLTGELSTNLTSPGEEKPGWGTLVGDRINSQHHQHMFCARLDLAVDDEEGGRGLQVSEVEVAPMDDGPDNPFGNGFVAMETSLLSESQAQRVCSPQTARYWKISNPASKHPVTGSPVAWKLMPQAAPLLLAKPDSAIAKRGAFAQKNLWVTPHSDQERWPAGDYPLQSTGGQGLAKWTQQDRPVGPGADPVVWYCFGVTHIPRPEDFPVMPVEVVGFHLKPFGFFDGNPAVDLPHTPDTGSVLANGSCCANGHGDGHANGNGAAN